MLLLVLGKVFLILPEVLLVGRHATIVYLLEVNVGAHEHHVEVGDELNFLCFSIEIARPLDLHSKID